MPQHLYSRDDVIDAIKGEGRWSNPDGTSNPCNGTVRAVCARMKVSRTTWYNWREKWPEISDVLAETREVDIDLAEEKLIDMIEEGHFGAVKLMLESRGSSRGYGRRALIKADLNVSHNPLEDLSDEELDQLLEE